MEKKRRKTLREYAMENNMEYLIDEWDEDANGMTVDEVSYGSHKKAYWKMNYHDDELDKDFVFRWEAYIQVRTRNGGCSCPILSGRKFEEGFNDLKTRYPKLAKEWDYEKNGNLKPENIIYNSNKIVHWILPYHDDELDKDFILRWQDSVSHRTIEHRKCPFLCGKAILIGFNDLKTRHPNLVKEWDYEKNEGLKPENFTVGSNKKVFWKMNYHDDELNKDFVLKWQDSILHRTRGHRNCPFLSGRKALVGFNDLKTRRPDIAKEWDYEKNGTDTPETVAYNSYKKYHWKMNYYDKELNKWFLFKWETTIHSRTIENCQCPYLCNKKILPGYNDLSTRNPMLAKELHPTLNGELDGTMLTEHSNKSVWWLCPICGNEYKCSPINRRRCPTCAKEFKTSFPEYAIIYYLRKYTTDIKQSFTDFGFELDIYLPILKIGIEYDGSYWHKNKKDKDLEKNKKCKNLGIKLYRFRANLDALNDYSIDIKCNENNKSLNCAIEKLIKNIFDVNEKVDVNKDRQKIEKDRIFNIKEKSLAVVRPDLASEWHPTKNINLSPYSITPKSDRVVWWYKEYYDKELKKTFKFEWDASVSERSSGSGCPYLSGKRVYIGFNDLATRYPKLVEQWSSKNKCKPTEVSYGSNKKIIWNLKYFDPTLNKEFLFEWEATIVSRTTKGIGCPYLSGKKVYVGFNDLATRYPDLVKEWNYKKNNGLLPQDCTICSGKKVWWIVHFDDQRTGKKFIFEWKDSIAHRTKEHRGCPYLSGQKLYKGFNDLETLFPNIAKLLHPSLNNQLKASNLSPGSDKKVFWKCPHCGEAFERCIGSMTRRKSYCPHCGKLLL